jgi:ABC-type Fe3+-hydroxamate transport system substrate-binding protein
MPASRIISLVPSLTELLHDLGLEEEVVGITKFCVHPTEWFRHKTRVGGTKDIRPDIIHKLQPDLIIANKEENQKQQVEELSRHYPVHVTNITCLSDALEMIRTVGALTGKSPQANALAEDILHRFAALTPARTDGPRTAYFIWRKPWMAAGGDTFIHDMLTQCGLVNIYQDIPRYPTLDLPDLAIRNCEVILLSSEPYPFKERHIEEIKQSLPSVTVRLVDGELFSWYGSRLKHSPAYFQQLRTSLDL